MDHAILQTAFDVREPDGGAPTIFVTMDTNLRIRADALGMVAETYENQRVEVRAARHRRRRARGRPRRRIDAFFHERRTSAAPERRATLVTRTLCVLLRDRGEPVAHRARPLRRRQAARSSRSASPREGVMGVRPRNKEQSFALDLLLDDSIRLVTLVGKAGTGKTLLALAAGLKRTVEDGAYSRAARRRAR